MNRVLYIILISLFTLTVMSCSSDDGGVSSSTTADTGTTDTGTTDTGTTDTGTTTTDTSTGGSTDTIAPKIFESVKVVTPTNDTTPSYTFISSDDGIIEYEGLLHKR